MYNANEVNVSESDTEHVKDTVDDVSDAPLLGDESVTEGAAVTQNDNRIINVINARPLFIKCIECLLFKKLTEV